MVDTTTVAITITVDTAVLGRRERDVRRGFTIPPKIGLGTLIDGALHPDEIREIEEFRRSDRDQPPGSLGGLPTEGQVALQILRIRGRRHALAQGELGEFEHPFQAIQDPDEASHVGAL